MQKQQKYRKCKGMTNTEGVFSSICPLHTSLDRYQHKGEVSIMAPNVGKNEMDVLRTPPQERALCRNRREGQSAQRGKAARKLTHPEPKAGLGTLLRNKKMLLVFLLFPGKRGPWLWSLTCWVLFLRPDEAPLPLSGED